MYGVKLAREQGSKEEARRERGGSKEGNGSKQRLDGDKAAMWSERQSIEKCDALQRKQHIMRCPRERSSID